MGGSWDGAWWREEPSVGPGSDNTIVFPANAGSTQTTGDNGVGTEGDILGTI